MSARFTNLKLINPPDDPAGDTVMQNRHPARKLGEILCQTQGVTLENLDIALSTQRFEDVRLGRILVAREMVSDACLLASLSQQFGAEVADFTRHPVQAELLADLNPQVCLKLNFLPWRRCGGVTLIATSNPARFAQVCDLLPADFGPVEMCVATRVNLQAQIARIWRVELTAQAEQVCPKSLSCRSWARPLGRPLILAVFILMVAFGTGFPTIAVWLIYGWVMLNLFAMSALRATGLIQQFKNWNTRRRQKVPDPLMPASIVRLPKISVLVPLYKEADILPKLVTRLSRTDYPKELLEICLILEAGDKKQHKRLH